MIKPVPFGRVYALPNQQQAETFAAEKEAQGTPAKAHVITEEHGTKFEHTRAYVYTNEGNDQALTTLNNYEKAQDKFEQSLPRVTPKAKPFFDFETLRKATPGLVELSDKVEALAQKAVPADHA